MEYKGFKGINLSPDTITKWLSTRKRKESDYISFGALKYPGLYITTNNKADLSLFIVAVGIEILFFTIVALMLGGFDVMMLGITFGLIVMDFIGAYLHHLKSDEIAKANVREKILIFEKDNLKTATDDQVRVTQMLIKGLKMNGKKIFGVFLIVLSAIIKVVGMFVILEMLSLLVVFLILFIFAAYIHINHTGYCFAYYGVFGLKGFINSLKYDLKDQLRDLEKQHLLIDNSADFEYILIENIPGNITIKEVQIKIFEKYDIYHSIVFQDNQWKIKLWKHTFFDDKDLELLLNSKTINNEVLDSTAKSFIAYVIIKKIFLKDK